MCLFIVVYQINLPVFCASFCECLLLLEPHIYFSVRRAVFEWISSLTFARSNAHRNIPILEWNMIISIFRIDWAADRPRNIEKVCPSYIHDLISQAAMCA